jgi:molecular chaperone DnaK
VEANEQSGIEAAKARIEEIAQKLAAKMYESAQAEAGESGAGDSGESTQDDDEVIDADFEESR